MGRPGCCRDGLRVMVLRDDGADVGEAPKCSSMPSTRSSGWSRSGSSWDRCPVQLQRLCTVQTNAHSSPTRPTAPTKKLTKAPRLLDLSDHGFDDRLALRVDLAAASSPELARHALPEVSPAGGRPRGRRPAIAVLLLLVAMKASIPALQRHDVAFGPVACIGQHRSGVFGAVPLSTAVTMAQAALTSCAAGVTCCATMTWACASTATCAL